MLLQVILEGIGLGVLLHYELSFTSHSSYMFTFYFNMNIIFYKCLFNFFYRLDIKNIFIVIYLRQSIFIIRIDSKRS